MLPSAGLDGVSPASNNSTSSTCNGTSRRYDTSPCSEMPVEPISVLKLTPYNWMSSGYSKIYRAVPA